MCSPSHTAGVPLHLPPCTFLSTAPALQPTYRSGTHSSTQHQWPRLARSLTVVANMSHVASEFERVLLRSKEMYAHGAYLHWYARHGCEAGEFLEAFEQVDGIIGAYRGMLPSGFM